MAHWAVLGGTVGASAHRRGQKDFHTLSPDRVTLNVSSVSAGPLALYSH